VAIVRGQIRQLEVGFDILAIDDAVELAFAAAAAGALQGYREARAAASFFQGVQRAWTLR
jgi:hypothetical protein